jgi:hypothetical protein
MAANLGLAGVSMLRTQIRTPTHGAKSYLCCSEMKPAEMLAPEASNYH